MVVFGIFLLVLGSISEWISDNSVTIGDKAIDMDALGVILLVLGALSVLIGIAIYAMATNTSHYEEHVVDEVPPVVEEKPVVVKRRKPRTPRKKKGI